MVLLMVVVGSPIGTYAREYAPPGLYDVDYRILDNGLHVVLKRRTHAHNVAVRLVVDVGHRHFPCDKRETAHFLEHLLFTGTSKHSETELDRIIEDHGGSWNATTSQSTTEYQIDIFDQHLLLAIDTLYEIITDTAITPETIETTRDIIHRELGGKTSSLRRWLYERGIGKSATTKSYEVLLPGTSVVCPGLDTPDSVVRKDVKQAYGQYYVPNNMSLIIVGNFDKHDLLERINDTFGQLAPSTVTPSGLTTPPYPTGPKEVTGTLSPLLDSSATVGVVYRTDGVNSRDLYALWALYIYLNRVLYEKIRVAEGLSYSPEAIYVWNVDYGIFAAVADTELDNLNLVRAMIYEELEELRQHPPNGKDIEAAKRRILLARVQGYESNAEVASYYVNNLHELKSDGRLSDHETAIAKLTATDIHQVVHKYLRKDRQVTMRSTPTLTYTQFYLVVGAAIVILTVLALYVYSRVTRRRTK
ncbi:MAG: M16 family metallopeptidase [Acidiferrobacterales bacterium]